MKAKNLTKLLSVLVGVLVIALLVFSVPAQALVLNLNLKDAKIEKGQKAVFDVSIDVLSSEPVTRLTLLLDGKSDVLCEFNPDGLVLSGCRGMKIVATSNSTDDYGYSYGYGYGTGSKTLSYQITIDTSTYETGDYTPKLTAYTAENVYIETSKVLTIKGKSGVSDGEYYSSTTSRVCVSGWKCSEWGECLDGKQTRTCDILPNCYLENMPAEERICLNSPVALRLTSLDTIKIGSGDTELENVYLKVESFSLSSLLDDEKSLVSIMFVLIVLIIIILILIIFALLLKKRRARKRRIRRLRHLNRIRYHPPRQ